VRVYQSRVSVHTDQSGFTNIGDLVQSVVAESKIVIGMCTVFIQHTSASLIIQENADPAVLRDLHHWMSELAPRDRNWEHADEGPDDMPAHARSAITKTTESIPVCEGSLALGTWQGLYLWEHRERPHIRNLVIHLTGTT
jgi:secondary thiamine-phosphate synthase enzyme